MPAKKPSSKPTNPRQANGADDTATGQGGEPQQQAGGSHPVLTTQQGIAVPDNQNALRATPRGPTRLEDFILRE